MDQVSRSTGRLVVFLSLLVLCGGTAPAESGSLADTKIAFRSHRADDPNEDIWTMKADGTGLVRLTFDEASNGPAWSPDGTKIAFRSGRMGDEIYVVNRDGTDGANLTNGRGYDYEPTWSPDGLRIAFHNQSDIWVMNVDGSGRINLTNSPLNNNTEAAWSPDGTKIAYARKEPERNDYNLWVMNIDGTDPLQLTDSSANDTQPAWSPDGSRIAFRRFDGNADIYLMEADGTNLVPLTDHSAQDFQPSWSPDGTKIAFASDRDGNAEIYTVNIDGSELTRLTYHPSADLEPAWSPFLSSSSTSRHTLGADLPGGVTMELVWIEPGTFTMGSPESEQGRDEHEGPQHEVTISRGFYLGKYEITQGQWEAVMESNPSSHKGSNWPVENISWNDVQFYIAKLNTVAGETVYRLPTEAEWEYACRAGMETRWSFGEDESQLSDYAWYSGNNSPSGPKDVGTKRPNPWGLYDMHGNVYEWCQDWYGSYSSGGQIDPTGPATGSGRVARGGLFHFDARYVRSATRYAESPGSSNNTLGARLLRMVEPVPLNEPPVANAGVDQTVEVGKTVILDGSGSSDPESDGLSYQWTAPVGMALSSTTDVRPQFTATKAGTYSFALVVNDGTLDSAIDEVVITVLEVPEPPGETVTVDLPGGSTMEFVWIEPGTFTMGSPSSESGRISSEGPQHEVTISQGFYLGKYEITQGQWGSVLGTTPWSGKSYVQSNAGHPAAYISWNDLQEFVGKLNEAAGEEIYRLPTEAEWEYACRAGTTSRWSFGDDESWLGDYAWYRENTWNSGLQYAQPVGLKLPNEWGLYDMHGNVWEWCQDWHGGYSSDAQIDPTGPATGSRRVARGGDWAGNPHTRSAYRSSPTPDTRSDGSGARLLRMAEPRSLADVNDAPSFTKGSDQTVNEDAGAQMVSGWATGISPGPDDESGQALTFLVSSDNSALFSVQPAVAASGTLTYTPAADANGSATVNVQLKDDGGTANGGADTSPTQTFAITVNPVNDAPTLSSIGNQTVAEDLALSLTLLGSDVDGDALTYLVSGNPVGSSLSGVAFSWTPDYDQSGSYTVTFAVSDGRGGEATEAVTITVSDVNRPPTMSGVENRIIEENQTLSFVLSGRDPDGDELIFSVRDNPAGSSLVDSVFSWTPSTGQAGTYLFSFTVSDGRGRSEAQGITITVGTAVPSNRPPTMSGVENRIIEENQTLSFVLSGRDPDGDELTYSVRDNPAGSVLSGNEFAWTPGFDQSGNYTVTFGVSDGNGGEATETVIITVSDVNRPPILTEIGNRSMTEGSAWRLTLSGSDLDGDALTYSVSGNPLGSTLSGNIFAWTPGFDQSGNYPVTFTLSDGKGGSASETITITVVDELAVSIPDPNLEAAIREALGKMAGVLTESDLGSLVFLAAFNMGISDLSGIEHCASLTTLYLNQNQISDISALAGLTQLTSLRLSGNQTGDISALSGLTHLTYLTLSGPHSHISDISALAGLTHLTELHFAGNQVSDISALAGLTQLTKLSFSDNEVSDITALTELTQLATLWFGNNQVSDISALAGLTQLTDLRFSRNQVSDILPLVAGTGLGSDDYLMIQNNPLSSFSMRQHIPILQGRGLRHIEWQPHTNQPPEITSTAVLGASVDSTYTYAVAATDSEGDTLKYSLVSYPNGMTIGTATGVVSWVPQDADAGDHSVVVRATDGLAGHHIDQSYTLTVFVINNPPMLHLGQLLSSLGGEVPTEGVLLSFSVPASDPDGDALTFSAIGNPPGSTLVGDVFSWTPTYDQAGPYTLTFSVSDGRGGTDTESIAISISQGNRSPALGAISDQSVREGQTVSFVVSASDLDSDPLTFSVLGNPTGSTLTSNTFSWTPDVGQAGSHRLVFTVDDGNGGTDSKTVTISVSQANRPPVLAEIEDRDISEGQLVSITLLGTDPERERLTYSVSDNPPGSALQSNVFSWTPGSGQAGSYPLDFTVTDAQGESHTQPVIITVVPLNRKPVLAEIIDRSIEEGQQVSFSLSATDSDGDDLIYTVSGHPAGSALEGIKFSWTPSEGQAGMYTLTFTVSDGRGGTDNKSGTITVQKANRKPVLADIANQSVLEGQTLEFTLKASDPDGDPLAYSVSGNPAGSTLSGGVFIFTPTADQTGLFEVIFTVTDAEGAVDTQSVTVTVTRGNHKPVLVDLVPRTIEEDQTLSFTVNANDIDGDELTYSVTGNPTGSRFMGNVFSWQPDVGQVGSYSVTFSVSDGEGGADIQTMVITVTEIPKPHPTTLEITVTPIVPMEDTDIELHIDATFSSLSATIVGHFFAVDEGQVSLSLSTGQIEEGTTPEDPNPGWKVTEHIGRLDVGNYEIVVIVNGDEFLREDLQIRDRSGSRGIVTIDFDSLPGNQGKTEEGGGEVGREYEVQLHIKDIRQAFSGWSITLRFNPDEIEFIPGSLKPSEFLPGLTPLPLKGTKTGVMEIGGAVLGETEGASGDAELATISFRLLDGFDTATSIFITENNLNFADGGSEKYSTFFEAVVWELLPVEGDFDGDGRVDFSDFFAFADAFGGSDPMYDLDGDGKVDFTDFFIFADNFGKEARAKLMRLAHEHIGLPLPLTLEGNFPNPFNASTTVRYQLDRMGHVELRVFDLSGQTVTTLVDANQDPGVYEAAWNARNSDGLPVSAGVYLAEVRMDGFSEVCKMVLVK